VTKHYHPTPSKQKQDDEKKFLLLPEDGNHDVAIFDPGSGVQLGECFCVCMCGLGDWLVLSFVFFWVGVI
jgi:hypothetical protein